MDSFAFRPELFEGRNRVLEYITDLGLVWFTDFASIDIAHDICGIEVTGIKDEDNAVLIYVVLPDFFPDWDYMGISRRDRSFDGGYKVVISKYPSPSVEKFKKFIRIDTTKRFRRSVPQSPTKREDGGSGNK